LYRRGPPFEVGRGGNRHQTDKGVSEQGYQRDQGGLGTIIRQADTQDPLQGDGRVGPEQGGGAGHLEVTVRREELVIDREPLTEAPVAAVRPPPEPLVVVLHEEVPVVNIRTRPYQEATVTVGLVTTEQPLTTELQHEHIQVETATTAGDARENHRCSRRNTPQCGGQCARPSDALPPSKGDPQVVAVVSKPEPSERCGRGPYPRGGRSPVAGVSRPLW